MSTNTNVASRGGSGLRMPHSPSWRSMRLHSDRHRGLSVQYNRREQANGEHSQQHDTTSATISRSNNNTNNHRPAWTSFLSPPVLQNVYRQQQHPHDPTTSAGVSPADDRPLSLSQHSDSHDVRSHRGNSNPAATMFHNSLNFNISSSTMAMAGAVANASHQQYQNQHCSKSPPPFLTVVLIRLTKALPDFCRLLVAAEPPDSSNTSDNNKDTAATTAANSIAAASQACSVLDTTVATATHNNNSHNASPASASSYAPGSPRFNSSSPNSEPGMSSSATPASPLSLSYWMSPSQAPPSPTTSALALEGEFESFASPFLLLAGAEVLTANLVHLQQLQSSSNKGVPTTVNDKDDAASSLSGLYQRIVADLERTEAVLCEPFLRRQQHDNIVHGGHHQSNEVTTSHSYYADAATAVAVSLRWLVLVTTVRGQLLDVQRAVFLGDQNAPESSSSSSSKLDLAQAATAVALLHQTVATATVNLPVPPELPLLRSVSAEDDDDDDDDKNQGRPNDPIHDAGNEKDSNKEDEGAAEPAAMPVVNNLLQELTAWKYCFETCAALERCQFPETIVSLRQWQLHLPPKKKFDTTYTRWMHQSFDDILSMLPFYFDRVQTFATPFYGFDCAALWKRSSDNSSNSNKKNRSNKLDCIAFVTDFLRRQEKLGGPPTAVGLILDAERASNVHTERGFRLSAAIPTNSKSSVSPVAIPDLSTNTTTESASTASTHREGSTEDNALGVKWPAIYLRSTLHLATSSSAASNNSSSIRASPRGSGLLRGSQGSSLMHLPTWSSSANALSGIAASPKNSSSMLHSNTSSPSNSVRKQSSLRSSTSMATTSPNVSQRTTVHHPSVFEYAPDTGLASSWPHSDWKSLVAIIDTKSRLAPPVPSTPPLKASLSMGLRQGTVFTYRYDQEEVASPELKESTSVSSVIPDPAEEVASFFSIRSPEATVAKVPVKDKRQSTFHIVSIGECLNLVVMVKEEESRWHLRRNRLEEDEIRDFLQDIAENLCISNVLSAHTVRERARDKGKSQQRTPKLHLPRDDNLTWADEKRIQDFLRELKEVFGLRPISPYMHDSSHSLNFYSSRQSPRTPVNPRALAAARRRRQRQNRSLMTALPESAEALFLGPELAPLFR